MSGDKSDDAVIDFNELLIFSICCNSVSGVFQTDLKLFHFHYLFFFIVFFLASFLSFQYISHHLIYLLKNDQANKQVRNE